MTIEQTRQMSIEFERRLQTMFPAAKNIAKIDTEDIFSFLNQYQVQYIQQLYMSEDQLQSGTRASILVLDITRSLTEHCKLSDKNVDKSYDAESKVFRLPTNYYLYIRSTSLVTGTYLNHLTPTVVPNTMIKYSDVHNTIESYYNDGRILRNPVVILEGDDIKVVHDKYTIVKSIDLTYIRLPKEFSILTNTSCELPYECFDVLVSGALDLYIKHLKAGGTPLEQERKPRNNQKLEDEE